MVRDGMGLAALACLALGALAFAFTGDNRQES